MIRSKWDQRIRRAETLGQEYPFAAQVLRFYGAVAGLQKELYTSMAIAGANLGSLALRFPDFLSTIANVAPRPLALCAEDLRKRYGAELVAGLETFWSGAAQFQPQQGREADLLMCLFLQPYAEYAADHEGPPPARETFGTCPRCSARPAVGVLRPEGDGGKRSLICALCATEWNIGRIVCPACAEDNVEELAVYAAEQFPHVRVEACDTCRYYIKTIDLTKDGHAVPVVDELATIPLNLWAREHEYVKLRPNLLGL